MPKIIAILGDKESAKGQLVAAFQNPLLPSVEKKRGDILEKTLGHVQTSAKSAGNRFTFYYTLNNHELEHSMLEMQYYTSISSGVIYTVGFHANEAVDQFKARVEQAVAQQKRIDNSDSQVLKLLVITNADLFFQEDRRLQAEKNQALLQLAQSEEMQLYYVTQPTIQECARNIAGAIKQKDEVFSVWSRALGYFLFAISQIIAILFLSNPLASLFSALGRYPWNNISNIAKNLCSGIIFPVWYPLHVLAHSLIYNPGWVKGAYSCYEASIRKIQSQLHENKHNIIVSLFIGCLITLSVLLTAGVLGPVMVGSIGIGVLAVKAATVASGFFGLSGLGTVGLAVFAGIAVGVAGSLLYGLGMGIYRIATVLTQSASPAESSVSSRAPTVIPVKGVGASQSAVYQDPHAASYRNQVFSRGAEEVGSILPSSGQISAPHQVSPV